MALTGIADDFFNVRYREKFFLQLFAGLILLQSGYSINSFHGIFGVFEIPYWLSIVVTLFVFLIIVNALNIIDGLDGLASLITVKFLIIMGGVIMIGANEMRTNMVIPIPILELINHRVSSSHKYRAILGAEMYSIENGIGAGLIDEVVDAENLMETAMLKAKDLATMGHPSYTLTKELLIREPLKKINDAISVVILASKIVLNALL